MKILDRDNLEKFDIVLVRFPEDETSLRIRQACNSNYSHAIIYLGDGSFIEGISPIVGLFSYNRYSFEDLNNVQVLRLKKDYKSKLNSKLAENFLRKLSYCNYSSRLLYFINKKNIADEVIDLFFSKQMWQGGIVCTSLVTLPYFIGGIDISKKNEPFYAHFGDIEKFDGFEDVTTIVFKDILPEEIDEDTFDYITTDKTGSILEKQSEIVKVLNTYVQKKYQYIIRNTDKYDDIKMIKGDLKFSTWESILPKIMKWYSTKTGKTIDKEFSELIISSGYNMLWFEEIHNQREQFFPFYYNKKFNKKDLEFLKKTMTSTYNHIMANEISASENFTVCPSRSNHIILDMYRSFSDLLKSSIDQYEYLLKMQ